MWALLLLFVCGLVIIIKGGDFFVDAATWMAEISGIPHFVVGATVVSVATTLPELIVSCLGAVRGSNAIAIGNAIGSVTANTGLIMAISVLCIPLAIKRKQYAVKSALLLAAIVILYLSSLGERFSLLGSVVLLLIFAISVYESIQSAKTESQAAEKQTFEKKELPINLIKFLIGAAGIAFGADFLVSSSTEIARVSGIPEAVISATIVAVGTSLPELVTAITAIAKKQTALSVGNIIGANLIDVAIILPVCSFVSGGNLVALPQNLALDIPACLLVLALAVVPMLIRQKFSRLQGAALLAIYLTYVAVICFFNPFPAA
ncbi:MAG: calcium/sodium antiporter [Clostridia bacterium]|nr:calcium/sodium antiporter [Clostridia bacterium]